MPTITITDEQQRALDKGEAITVDPPRKFNVSFVPNGSSRQKWHGHGKVGTDERQVAINWLRDESAVRDTARLSGGGIIAVCDEMKVNLGPKRPTLYALGTMDARYFRVSPGGLVSDGI